LPSHKFAKVMSRNLKKENLEVALVKRLLLGSKLKLLLLVKSDEQRKRKRARRNNPLALYYPLFT